MSNKIKVLIILPSLESGGVESYSIGLANFLAKSGHEVKVVSAGGRSTSRLNSDIDCIKNNVMQSKNIINILYRSPKIIYNIIESFKPDICHIMSRASAWSCDFALKRIKNNQNKPKIVYTVHGAHSVGGFLKKKYNSIIYKNKDKIIAVSDYVEKYLIKNYKEIDLSKLSVIYPVYNSDFFNKKSVNSNRMIKMSNELQINDNAGIIFLIASRISESKGYEFIIKSIKDIKSDNFTFIFCGKAENKKYLIKINKLIKELNLDSKIIINEPLNDMPALYAISDYVVVPSLKPETFGLVPVEASAMGKVCIVTDAGFLPFHVEDNKSGWIVRKNDHEQMKSVIEEAINLNESDYKKKSNLAINKIIKNQNYINGHEKCLDLYLDLLKDVNKK